MTRPWLVLVESNTTGSGRLFCAAARERGLRPVVLASDPSRYPYLETDGVDVRVTDTRDPAAVSLACREAVALAGVASSSEYFVATAARVAAEYGLPCPDAAAVERCRDKVTQRDALAGAGLGVPRYATVSGVADAVAVAGEFGFPVVLKPTAGSGSVGVRLCADAAAVREWARRLCDVDGHVEILVESYVDGPEFSVETVDDTVVAVVGKHLGPAPYFVETGHDIPARAPAEWHATLGATATDAVAALRLGWGAAHTELRMTPGGPVVIEVNPRLAGGMIPAAIHAVTGTDLVDLVVARHAGHPPPPVGPVRRHAAIRFAVTTTPGRVGALRGLPQCRELPGVRAAGFTVTEGQDLTITHSFRDRTGYAVAAGPDAGTAAARAQAAVACLTVDIDQVPATQPEPTTSATSPQPTTRG